MVLKKKVSANIHGSKRKGPEKKILLLTSKAIRKPKKVT